KAAVPALLAVVTHHEIFSRRHNEFTVLNRAGDFRSPGGRSSRQILAIRWRKIVARAKLVDIGGVMANVRFILRLPINKNLPVKDSNMVTGSTHHALYKVLAGFRLLVGRCEFKNHHVPPAGIPVRQQMVQHSTLWCEY